MPTTAKKTAKVGAQFSVLWVSYLAKAVQQDKYAANTLYVKLRSVDLHLLCAANENENKLFGNLQKGNR